MTGTKRMSRWLSVAVLAAIVLVLVAASPVLAYLYRAPFTIANNSSTDYAALTVNCSADVDWLIANGFITTATALDTRVETFGGVDQPHMMASDRIMVFAPTLNDHSQLNWYLSTGNTPLASFPVITGYGGYVTVADAAALKLGNNFSLLFKGGIGTGYLVYKGDSFILASNTTIVGVAVINGTTAPTLRPSGAGDETSITSVTGASTHWEAESDASDSSYVSTGAASYQTDLYQLADIDNLFPCPINSVTAYFRIYGNSATAYAKPVFKIDGGVYEGAEQSKTAGADWSTKSQVYATSPATNTTWSWDEINMMQFGVSLKSTNGRCGDVWLIVNYDSGKLVTVSGISDSEAVVNVSADGTNMVLTVNDYNGNPQGNSPQSVALAGVSATDNANNWTISIPYFDYYKHSVNGALIAWYQPVSYIVDTTLPDREGAAQNGAITWGSNPAGVSVTLGSLTAEAISIVVDDDDDYVDPLHDAEVSDWFLEPDIGVKLANHPLRPLVQIMSDGTTVTEVQAWRFLGLAILLLVTVSAAVLVRGHLLIAGLACGGAIALLAQQTVWPGWTLVFIIPAIVAGLLAERTPSIG